MPMSGLTRAQADVRYAKVGVSMPNRYNVSANYGARWDACSNSLAANGTFSVQALPGLSALSSVLITPAGQAFGRYLLPAAIDWSFIDYIYVPVIPRDVSTGRSISFWLQVYFDTGYANYAQYQIDLDSLAPGQLSVVAVNLKNLASAVAGSKQDGYLSITGTANWANVVGFGIRMTASSGASADNYLYIGDMLTDQRSQPRVMIGFDGNYLTQWKSAAPLLKKYDTPATFYLQKYQLGFTGSNRMSLAMVQQLVANGHKAALHSYSKDLDTTNNTTFPTAASITAEITGFVQWANSVGLPVIANHACVAIASPWETPPDFATAKKAIDGYTGGALTSVRLSAQNYNPMRPHAPAAYKGFCINTMQINASSNNADVSAFLNAAVDAGGVCSLYTHDVLPNGSSVSGTQILVSQLDYTLSTIATLRSQGKLQVVTPDQI